jgi:hypothetical protein
MRARNDGLVCIARKIPSPTAPDKNSLAAKKFPRQREKPGQIAPKAGSMQNSSPMVGYRL